MDQQPTIAQDEKLFATVGYLGILCLVPLLLKKNSPFCQHHGRQGLVLLIAWCLLWVGNIIPVIGQIVWVVGSVPMVILMILGMVNAWGGKTWEMPVLGDYAKQIKM